jgi:hypothetical protein
MSKDITRPHVIRQGDTLAGVASGAILGLGGLVFAYFNAKAERVHGERLARSGRLHEQRRLAYVEIARLLERQRLVLVRTHPKMGPKPDPPEPLNDDEWAAVSALAAVSPSSEVEAALRETVETANAFGAAVSLYEFEKENPTASSVEGKSAWVQMDDVRARAIAAIAEAERSMRDELATL